MLDLTELYERIADLERRMAGLVRPGRIKEIDYSNLRAKVETGDILTDWLPWSQSFGIWNPPLKGEPILLLSPGGELDQGIIFRSATSVEFPSPSNSDNSIVIDLGKRSIKIKKGNEDLLQTLADALEIIETSTTPTMMGPQEATQQKVRLPEVRKRLESFYA